LRPLFFCFTLILLPLLSCEGDGKKKVRKNKGAVKSKHYTVKSHRNLVYVSDKEVGRRKLDLYIPKGADSPPLFLYIHGGAWITGDKSLYSKLGRGLAARGIATAIINYRLSSRANKIRHPSATLDGAAAVYWLQQNAKKYGYDSSCFVVGGHSAGAHMTGLLLLDPGYLGSFEVKPSSIAGAIGLEGIYDIPRLVKRWPDYRNDFLEVAFGPDKGWGRASPQSHVKQRKDKCPWLIIHSPKDELVDIPQSESFVKALKDKGATVKFFAELSSSHFGTVKNIGGRKDKVTELIVDFIHKLKRTKK
jgi:kynurenine formamidase